MKQLHYSLFLICLIIIVAMIPSIGFAQLPPDSGCDPVIGCPIDGGVSLLIALGIGIGAKKSYTNQKSGSSKKI